MMPQQPIAHSSRQTADSPVMTSVNPRLPAIFFGHGNPMNALGNNAYARAWAELGARLPRPRAVLCISAHWYLPQLAVTAMANAADDPRFRRFPARAVRSPVSRARRSFARARGPAAARAARRSTSTTSWGLDHGTWSVLCHVFPNADVPVIQLSIDETRAPQFHYEIGQRVRPLRDAGVLIVGSGDVVHNLHAYAWGKHPVEPYDWAARFEIESSRARRCTQSRAAYRLRLARPGRVALGADAGALSAAALRTRRGAGGRRDHISRRRHGRRLGVDARRANRIEGGEPR